MKNIGIWMDREKAHIIRLENKGENLETLFSEVEFFNRKGTSGPRVKSGVTQDVKHERTYLEREKAQLKTYFKKLADTIGDADAIALFGPADTNEKFRKELMENHKDLAAKVKTVTKTDSMTENQTKALVRDFFGQKK
jgi:stalled ribosome rescue protein Dom34